MVGGGENRKESEARPPQLELDPNFQARPGQVRSGHIQARPGLARSMDLKHLPSFVR